MQATENSGLKALLNKAVLVDEIDSLLPDWFIKWVSPSWFPPYIQVLRAGPNTVNCVKLDESWPVKDVTEYETKAAELRALAGPQGGVEKEHGLRDAMKELAKTMASLLDKLKSEVGKKTEEAPIPESLLSYGMHEPHSPFVFFVF